MRCWACAGTIHLRDIVAELPIVGTLVHESCYAREAGHAPAVRVTLADRLRASKKAA